MKTVLALLVTLSCSATALAQDANGSSGGPYGWTTMGGIKKLPHDGRPDAKVEFPQIQDWKSLKISLQRAPCFGSCPAYRVDIHGDGTVVYDGQMYVAIPGIHKAKITDDSVHSLFAAFQKADFFWLLDSYAAPITDNPTKVISISFDGRTKDVKDYVGRAIGMPQVVTELESLIDTTADTKKWVVGNAETIDALKSEGWRFSAPDDQNVKLLEGAAETHNADLVEELLKLGMPATNKYGCRALSEAARHRDVQMARALFTANAPIRFEPHAKPVADPHTEEEQQAVIDYYESACDVLQTAATFGSPEIVELVLSRKPDVNETFPGSDDGRTPLMSLAGNSGDPMVTQDGANFGRCAQLLIEAGADVNAVDKNGNTAIMGAGDIEVVRAIIAAGVKDINARNSLGQTALMRTYDTNVIRALLEAGADPYLKDKQGQTAMDHAADFNDPKLKETLENWMRGHPKPPQPDHP